MRVSYKWGVQVLLGIDQLANAVLFGWAEESISARSYRMSVVEESNKKRWSLARKLIDGLFFWEDNHTQNAYQSEQERLQLPPSYRQ